MANSNIIAVHHLNCCTNMPGVGRLFNEQEPCRVVSHCILIETGRGLVLIDTGIGLDDMKHPERLGFMRIFNRPRLDDSETAIRQVQKLGFSAHDLQHIVMTHLDLDHTGGLPDFPHARVHVLQREYEAAMKPRGFKENGRYRKAHWAHSPDWVTYKEQYNEPWFGFDSIRQLNGLPPEIILVRLPGHSRGHCGVAINTSDGWLLHAGDAYYFHKQMQDTAVTTPMVHLFQRFAHLHYQQAMQTKDKLRNIALKNKTEMKVLCSHDTEEFESLSRTRVRI